MVIGMILAAGGVTSVNLELQKWAAIISKAASDMVAGVIEGLADRHKNIQIRLREYTGKFAQLFDIYAQLELLNPDVQTFKILDRSDNPERRTSAEARDLEKIIMIHALDLLYFWLYQPRARTALRQFLHTLGRRRTPHSGQQPVYFAAAPRDLPAFYRRNPGRQLPPPPVFLFIPLRGLPERRQTPDFRRTAGRFGSPGPGGYSHCAGHSGCGP